MNGSAMFSPCGIYRYTLTRDWGDSPRRVCWIMLNPSTADADTSDPTITRCTGFSKAWGYSGLIVVNLFAFRSTDPENLYEQADPVGPENDGAIADAAKESAIVVAAWGNHGAFRMRDFQVKTALRRAGVEVCALRLTQTGAPAHPLYLPAKMKPFTWIGR